jgi:NAD-dependent SIR2 family protein deacetylase
MEQKNRVMDNVKLNEQYVLTTGTRRNLLDESDSETNRLQALLAQWMRMENVVVLAGAGTSCSSAIGGKTLGALEKAILELLKVLYQQSHKENLTDLITHRKADREGLGFEQWLSHLSNAHYLLSQANSPIKNITWEHVTDLSHDELATLLSDLEKAIFAYCSLTLPGPYPDPTGHHAFLIKLLARDPSLGRTHLFTTNYDTVFEQALDDLAAQYQDGFVGRVRPRFEPSVYGLDVYYPGEVSEGRVRRFDKFLHLYKLHGSINWRADVDSQIKQQGVPLIRFKRWQELEDIIRQANAFSELFDDNDAPIGILPTAKKFADTLELPYAHLFRIFHQRLQEPQTFLLVVGYGFGDDHINQIIDDAMLNPGLVLLVIDPSPGINTKAKIEQYQSIGERAYLLHAREPENPPKTATFDDFAINVMPHVKFLDEWVKLRRLEKTIRNNTSFCPEGGQP